MTRTEFFTKIVASGGRFCVFTAKPFTHNEFFPDAASAEQYIDNCVQEGRDVWYGLGAFGDIDKRTATNVRYLKSFFLDLDCGEEKAAKGEGYVSQSAALTALKDFLRKHEFPAPMLVSSGRGIHAYWPLQEAVTYEEWKPIAEGFKKLCLDSGLTIDPVVPADAARILRPILTKNFKDPEYPLDVELLRDAPCITLDAFRDRVPVQNIPVPRAPLDATTRALLGNKTSKFKNILIKTVEGAGCEQLKWVMENPEMVGEPMWRAMLSIAWTCEDRDKAIHVVSKGHPEYDHLATIKKAEQTTGPYLCTTIEPLNPGGCDKCMHRGKFASPIRLGDEVVAATPEQSLFEVVEETPEGVSQVVTLQIPEYPNPYLRGQNGGVYKRSHTAQGAVEDTMVYRYDFYITKRMSDTDRGETLMANVHFPKDGVKSFPLPLVDAMASDRLRDRLAMQGVVVNGAKEWQELMRYVTSWTNTLQSESEAEISRTQFGWADDDQCFVIGDREIRKGGGIRFSPPSAATLSIAPLMKKKGTVKDWKSVINMYARPGMEIRAFALFMGFGAPLIKYTPLKGALLNLMSPESGTGKSTIQMAINSIYGAPYDLLLQKADTANAKMHRVGIMNNLPVTIDEITNMPPEQMSELAYAITQGRGKERMESQGNKLRVNNTRWSTIVVSSGNSSIYDKLASLKASADGEMMRIMEFKVDRDDTLTKEESDKIFNKLFDNYGVAGDAYITYLLDDPDAVRGLMEKVKAKVDSTIHFSSRERFWSAMITCAMTGGIIAKSLGLHDIDPHAVLNWLTNAIAPMRIETVVAKSEPVENLGVFLVEHARHTLVINGNVDARTGLPTPPEKEPYGDLLVRWEPDTGHIFISTVHFRKWCTERQISYKDLVDDLEAKGICTRGEKKRMSTGTKLPGATINALRIDAVKGGFHAPTSEAGAEAGND